LIWDQSQVAPVPVSSPFIRSPYAQIVNAE